MHTNQTVLSILKSQLQTYIGIVSNDIDESKINLNYAERRCNEIETQCCKFDLETLEKQRNRFKAMLLFIENNAV